MSYTVKNVGTRHPGCPYHSPHPESPRAMPAKSMRRVLRRGLQHAFVSAHDSSYPAHANRFTSLWHAFPQQRVEPNRWIAEKLSTSQPFCVARFGADEFELTQDWRRRTTRSRLGHILEILASGDPFYTTTRARTRMKKRGLSPLTPGVQKRFYDLMVDSMHDIDLLGSWIVGETWFSQHLQDVSVCPIGELEPYRSDTPWSAHLTGKRVLVVHPFAQSITSQYTTHREKLFESAAVLPEFTLDTLIPPRAHFGEVMNANHWFQSLDELIKKTLDRTFDVAIIGAGPFGLPLASAIKTAGKQAIHLGGATQLLFGIRGARWEGRPDTSALMSDYWARPLPEETPPSAARKMSGESYW